LLVGAQQLGHCGLHCRGAGGLTTVAPSAGEAARATAAAGTASRVARRRRRPRRMPLEPELLDEVANISSPFSGRRRCSPLVVRARYRQADTLRQAEGDTLLPDREAASTGAPGGATPRQGRKPPQEDRWDGITTTPLLRRRMASSLEIGALRRTAEQSTAPKPNCTAVCSHLAPIGKGR